MAEYDEGQWFDTSTTASHPGDVDINFAKLAWFRNKLNWGHRYLGAGQAPAERWATHLKKGLADPAIVVAVRPTLIVSAYTSEFDCVAILKFKDGTPEPLDLQPGSRLLAVSTFMRPPADKQRGQIEPDLIPIAGRYSIWFGFHPVIADFVSKRVEDVEERKRALPENEWRRVEELASEYRRRFPSRYRNGNPYLSHMPAK